MATKKKTSADAVDDVKSVEDVKAVKSVEDVKAVEDVEDVKAVDKAPSDDTKKAKEAKPAKVRTINHESFAHRLYVSDFNIAFVEKRRIWFLISGILVVACLSSIIFRGLNLGVDFTGGSVFQVNTTVDANSITDYTATANSVGLPDMGGLQVTTMGNNAVRLQMRTLTTDEVTTMREALAAKAGVDPTAGVNYTLIGPSWGKQITSKGIQAMVIFLVLVALMIGLYFRNWKMSLAAMIGLFHDLIVTVGIYSMVGFTVSPATITGILTILGYSLYDNVVVFDKVRENVVDLERKDFSYSQAADLAVNQVFVRSINTTIVGVLPVLAILLAGVIWLGGQGPLPDLGLAMFVGMITGAWSSIFIATPILCMLKEAEPAMKLHREGVERRMGKAQTQVMITTTLAEQVPALASAQVSAVPVPVEVRHAPSAGRPQPARQSRSQRKG